MKRRNYNGKNNPMYGKSVYDIWVDKYGKEEADRLYSLRQNKKKKYKVSKNTKDKISKATKGKNNPMYGKSVYDIWVDKYGKEEADKKNKIWKQKQSKKLSGKNNPMYGKPSPMGSGNGWSGWYKGYFFRSILELSYLKYLIDNNIKFINCDNKKEFKIKYLKNGQERNYFPDFYLENTQEIIEVKPYKAVNYIDNKIKFKAAKRKYKNKFLIITDKIIKRLDNEIIIKLHEFHDLKFIDRYEKKYLEFIK